MADNYDESNIDENSVTEENKTEVNKVEVNSTTEQTELNLEGKAKELFDKKVEEKVASIINDRVGRSVNKANKLQEELDALNKDKESTQSKVDNLNGEIVSLKDENLKLKLALSEGVSFDLIDSLKGETEEELRNALSKIKNVQKDTTNKASDKLFEGKAYGEIKPNTYESDVEALKNIRF